LKESQAKHEKAGKGTENGYQNKEKNGEEITAIPS